MSTSMKSSKEMRACDLVEGDWIVSGASTFRVLSIEPSEVILRRTTLIVTVQMKNGRTDRLSYLPNRPVIVGSRD